MAFEQGSRDYRGRLPERGPVTFMLRGPFVDGYIDWLCGGPLRSLCDQGARVLICDVGWLDHPDFETVNALARLQLAAKRLGCELRLRQASTELRELLDLAGLEDAFFPNEEVPSPETLL